MGATGHRQHLIDPETCIRCNTCETRCPTKAISHERNYVVDPDLCRDCRRCVRPCPTGAIDHWLAVAQPYSIGDQLAWSRLPAAKAAGAPAMFDPEAERLLREAERGDGPGRAPISASRPAVSLFTRDIPARATVTGNLRITSDSGPSEVHHIILDFGATPFPYLEGQSVGLIPPGRERDGSIPAMRLYSIASARDGERPNTNNLALAVKRITRHSQSGGPILGLASNWLCDLAVGAEVDVVGPFGATFLMPDDPDAHLLMICTGTGVSPFRGFTHRRRRTSPNGRGRLYLFYGARSADELPYFGPLQGYEQAELHRELVYSRVVASEREYVQDRLRGKATIVAELLRDTNTHLYVCGLRGLETGVDAALTAIGHDHHLDWPSLRQRMHAAGRLHVEVY
ncbi:4Fe-4S binding protein [uncultured Methylobacterium sp.]|jgi:benzoyl-CoA 2,3-dioxygenase component A|uniref:4Fe-4S binding protein n=1 Tax=uncultured Methylobacterium sp. TaxID=157278 RepID=UPI002632CD4B|nr:4Fe-4S binding protein [uncultured Methylobacterium sp.]